MRILFNKYNISPDDFPNFVQVRVFNFIILFHGLKADEQEYVIKEDHK